MHAQIGRERTFQRGLIRSRAVVAAARSAPYSEKPLVFENARRLLDCHNTDAEELSDFIERADLRAGLACQNRIAQFRGCCLYELASWELCHAFCNHKYLP